jgi:hypothetical protein
MSDEVRYRADKQIEGAPPVIEDPKLPRMGEESVRPKTKSKLPMMPEKPQPPKGKNLMPKSAKRGSGKPPRGGLPPQTEAKAAAESESYIRLRVRVENGEMSVVESHEIEGPLSEPSELRGTHAYELTIRSTRLHAGSIPDLGVWRSFPDPEGPLEHRGHHITEPSTFEFNVRVPRKALSASTLSKAEIALYRVKEPTQNLMLTAAPLSDTSGRELREVARLKGLPSGTLSRKKR